MEDQEKKDIQDAQISEVETVGKKLNPSVATDRLKNKNYHTEIILIFIIGLLLGIMIKAESLKKVSMGFSDYRVTGGTQEYKMDEIEKALTEKLEKEAATQQEQQAPDVQTAPQAGE